MKNKFWLFYIIAVSLVLSFGMVSASVPTVEDISNPSISLVANETNNTQQVICRYSDADGYNNISYSDSYFDLGSLVSDSKVNFTSADVNDVWDLNGVKYQRYVGTNDNDPAGLFFGSNGSFMYEVGTVPDVIYQYNLTDSWNITSASLIGSLTRKGDDNGGMYISPDGTRLYETDYRFYIYQFNLTDPWNVSSGVYLRNMSIQNNFPNSYIQDVYLKGDGSKMFVNTYGSLAYFNLTDSWNITSASLGGSVSFDCSSAGIFFRQDGTQFFSVNNDYFCQYSLTSDPWNVSIMKKQKERETKQTYTTDVFVGDSGRSLYEIGTGAMIQQYSIYPSASIQVDQIPYYRSPGNYPVTCEVNDRNSSGSLSENLTVNTLLASDVNVSSVNFGSLSPGGSSSSSVFKVENTGNVKLNSSWNATDFTSDNDSINISSVDLFYSTPWNLTLNLNAEVDSVFDSPEDLFFGNNGSKFYEVGVNGSLAEYGVSNWDISTLNYVQMVSLQSSNSRDIFFKPDGTKMYGVGWSSDKIYQYSLTDPWNISSLVYEKNISTQDGSPEGIFFKPDGTKMYEIGETNSKVYQYSLSDPWNISSAVFDTSVSTQHNYPQGIFFRSDGKVYYEVGAGFGPNKIYKNYLTDPWNISSVVYSSESVLTEDNKPTGIFFNLGGSKLFEIGTGSNKIYEHLIGKKQTIGYTTKLFKQLESQIGVGNENRLYQPHFKLSVPLGTPAGSYSNTFTHSISQA